MKTLKYIFAALVGLTTVSCYNMDITPRNVLGDDVLLNSDAGIRKYLTIVYHDLPIEDFNYYINEGYTVTANSGNKWEGTKNSPSSVSLESVGFFTGQYEDFGYWDFRGDNGPYYRIRNINNFLAELPKYADNFSQTELLAYESEARFLRAFYYFGLVRRYGGVVLMSDMLDPLSDPIEQMIARSTEYESWKFIYDDLKFAMDNGADPKTNQAFASTSRGHRYAAAALMSRAMLYAGTIAKYGHHVLPTGPAVTAGLQGMPADKAVEFFQYVLDAAALVQQGGYALHTGADKEMAFVEVFQNDTVEDIFVKKYGTKFFDGNPTNDVYLMHNYDVLVLPLGSNLSGDIGSTISPTWDLVDLYEHPAIQTDEEEPRPVRFNSREEFWQSPEMEARLRATIYFSGMAEQLSGTVFDIQAGVYLDYPGTVLDGTADTDKSTNEYTGDGTGSSRRLTDDDKTKTANIPGYGEVRLTGEHGSKFGMENRTNTGTVIRKYVSTNPVSRTKLHLSEQTWKVFRYGEVLLNRAEAAYELGLETGNAALKAEAFTYIAELRERAGAKPYAMKANPDDVGMMEMTTYGNGVRSGKGRGYGFSVDENLQFIRDERGRELAFENHRIYDLIRWRVADKEHPEVGGRKPRFMRSYRVLNEDKWIFLPELNYGNGRALTFPVRRYYNQIPGGVKDKNDLIIINDGY